MNKGLKEKIINLYTNGKGYEEIKLELDCSKGTISYHLKNHKLQEKIDRFEYLKAIENETFKTKIEFLDKYKDKLSNRELNKLAKKLFHKESSAFKSGSAEYHRNRRREIKNTLVIYKGGKCEICGYNKCLKALQFHHTDPKQKDFTISSNIKSFDLEKVKKEVDKCILVCSNCHAEIHDNMSSLVVEANLSAKQTE